VTKIRPVWLLSVSRRALVIKKKKEKKNHFKSPRCLSFSCLALIESRDTWRFLKKIEMEERVCQE